MNDAVVAYDALSEDRKKSINGNPSKCVETRSSFLNAARTSIVHFEARVERNRVSSVESSAEWCVKRRHVEFRKF